MNCLLCKGKSQKSLPLCSLCQRELPWHPLNTIAFQYQPPIEHWITRLKFRHELHYAKLLGLLFTEKLKNHPLPECIVPIPLSRRRLCHRGFNQALEIAKPLSRALKIPIDTHLLKRTRHTQSQSKLNEKQRKENLKDAFLCDKNTSIKSIALLDDVITTGSTIQAAIYALQEKIPHIEVWSCAKTKSFYGGNSIPKI